MKKFAFLLAALMLLTIVYYIIWRAELADDVARVRATITYQNDQFRAHNRWIEFKADAVYGQGFPFHAYVHVVRPTLTFISGDETFGVSLPWADLHPRGATTGTYEVTYPVAGQALYAKSGIAPEQYDVTPSPAPALLLRAQGDSTHCPTLPGPGHCPPVAATDPLISFAAQIPSTLTLNVTTPQATKQIVFHPMMALDVPIYRTIPADMDQPVEIFVNMLREAFQRPQ